MENWPSVNKAPHVTVRGTSHDHSPYRKPCCGNQQRSAEILGDVSRDLQHLFLWHCCRHLLAVRLNLSAPTQTFSSITFSIESLPTVAPNLVVFSGSLFGFQSTSQSYWDFFQNTSQSPSIFLISFSVTSSEPSSLLSGFLQCPSLHSILPLQFSTHQLILS